MPLPPWFGQSQQPGGPGAPPAPPTSAPPPSGPSNILQLNAQQAGAPQAGAGGPQNFGPLSPQNILQLTGLLSQDELGEHQTGAGGNQILNVYGTSTPQTNPLIQSYQGNPANLDPQTATAATTILTELAKAIAPAGPAATAAPLSPQDLSNGYKQVMGLLDWGWANFPQFQQNAAPNPGGPMIPSPAATPLPGAPSPGGTPATSTTGA